MEYCFACSYPRREGDWEGWWSTRKKTYWGMEEVGTGGVGEDEVLDFS